MFKNHKKAWIIGGSIALGVLLIVGIVIGTIFYLSHRLYDRMNYDPDTDFSIPASDSIIIGPSFDFSKLFPSMANSSPEKGSSIPSENGSESESGGKSSVGKESNSALPSHGVESPVSSETPNSSQPPVSASKDDPATNSPSESRNPASESSSPNDPSSPDIQIPPSLTLEQLKALYEMLLKNQTTTPAVQPAEQEGLEQAIKEQYDKNMKNPISNKDVYNLLVIGYDFEEGRNYKNSDTMIVVSVNYSKKTLTLTSIMRDSYVYIPGVGYNRLNTAYAVGGYGLLKATIERNFGIVIDNYVALQFEGFVYFYNLLGEVTVEIPNDEAYLAEFNKQINSYYHRYGASIDRSLWRLDPITPGKHSLDAVQLLMYARNRTSSKGDADFGRTSRQRELMTQTISVMRKMGVTELYDLMYETLPMVTTDLTYSDCYNLFWKVINNGVLDYTKQDMRIPADGTYKNIVVRIGGTNQDVLSISFESNKKKFFTLVYGSYSG